MSRLSRQAPGPTSCGALSGVFLAHWIIHNDHMRELRLIIRAVSNRVCNVLIQGEAGTGKEWIAQRVHAHGRPAMRPFVPFDCTTLRDRTYESQLFGAAKGFKGGQHDMLGCLRAADRGTLYLANIGELDCFMQDRLLKCLKERAVVPLGADHSVPVNARLIVTTRCDLKEMVDRGDFREELFRLTNEVCLRARPLRERRSDILPLVNHFLAELAALYQEPLKTLDSIAIPVLESYPWPGNDRELLNVIQRANMLCSADVVTEAHLREALRFVDDAHCITE